jgi:hypothetical protein
MTIHLDHTVVPSRNKVAAAQFGGNGIYWNEPTGTNGKC